MLYQNFELACVNAELPAVQKEDGDWLFHSPDVCIFADLVNRREDSSRWVRDNIPTKWFLEYRPKNKKGRPGIYLTLPGFLYSLSLGTSEIALNFRDEVYEKVLPAIITKGGYISETASSEQLEALQQKITFLQKERDVLKSWLPNMPMHKIRFLEIINYKGNEYSPFLQRNGYKSIEFQRKEEYEQYQKNMRDQKLFLDLIDTLFSGEKQHMMVYQYEEDNWDTCFEKLKNNLPVKLYRVLINQYQDFKKHEHPKPAKQYEQFQFSVELKNERSKVWLEYVPEKKEMLKSYLFEPDRQLVG